MAEPTSYPTWRYWQDGRKELVPTPEEYAALPPGHSDRPDGPWEEGPKAPPAGDQAAHARALREAGRSRKAIAEALGVTEYTVRRWLEDP